MDKDHVSSNADSDKNASDAMEVDDDNASDTMEVSYLIFWRTWRLVIDRSYVRRNSINLFVKV